MSTWSVIDLAPIFFFLFFLGWKPPDLGAARTRPTHALSSGQKGAFLILQTRPIAGNIGPTGKRLRWVGETSHERSRGADGRPFENARRIPGGAVRPFLPTETPLSRVFAKAARVRAPAQTRLWVTRKLVSRTKAAPRAGVWFLSSNHLRGDEC